MICRILVPAVVIAMFVAPSRSTAGTFGHELLRAIYVPDCVGKRCCDEYCPKPLPCPVDVKQFSCDVYCPKSMPCPVKFSGTCCDDYCPKPPPRILCPPCADLKCPPPL